MKLTQHEIQQAMEKAKAAFPNFTDWKCGDETDNDDMHTGFTLWGEYSPDPEALPSKHFFVTFDTYKDTWSGNLSIGKHCYFWSSADFGDAHLINTVSCKTLEDAITALKAEMASLFRAFSAI